jgi:hypothetical protein
MAGNTTAIEDETGPPETHSERRWIPSRALLSKIGFELFAVFAGVTAAFAVDDYRNQRDEDARRQAIYRALDRELKQMAETHGPAFQKEITQELSSFDQAVAKGERPLPPAFKLPGAERPPTGVWDAAIASDSIELVDPELFYELARFYNRANSVGNLYQRYATYAQSDVWPHLADGPAAFWQPNGKLRPEIQAHIQRLRDFQTQQGRLGIEARQLRKQLQRSSKD